MPAGWRGGRVLNPGSWSTPIAAAAVSVIFVYMHLTYFPNWRGLFGAVRRFAAGLGLAWAAAVGPANAAEVQAVEVAPRIWFVQGEAALGSPANRNFISNAGFVVTDEGVVVIDGLGSPALAIELLAEIRRVTPLPVRQVIVTHYHADHIYGLQVLKAAGASVLAHPAAREYIASDTAQRRLEASRQELAPWVDDNTRIVPADRWLDGAETRLRLGRVDFVVRHLGPAHTPEDLVVYVPAAGVLFAGDLVFRGRVPFVGQADSRQWIASLERLIEWQPRLVVPGHGPVSDAPLADLQLTRDYLVHLRKTMGEAARNLEPFEEAYERADWSRFERLPLFRVANRMNAYNTYLLLEQQGAK
jgi:glyoxylase-like metal-dependent hydrolase (beta-lactamase superfamily II)